ncbi:MAG TPA: ABC transporter ATP-binding protein [Candidatus Limnocylindrales bacterium]|jgi:ABC-type sugar transport system ATPase subunit
MTTTASTTDSATGTQYAIEILGVTKRYGKITALGGVDLDIEPGEFVVLLGPSGCGKSTLLKIIAGLEDLTEGEVYIGGKLANYLKPSARDVAMVFQNYALYPHMTVRANIGFPLKMAGRPKGEIEQQVAFASGLLQIGSELDKYPDELSGGQRQRVALGRAIVRQPLAFLMDEPLSNLDALLRVQMRSELLRLHKRVGRTTVYVTHDQIEAMTMADRVVVMRNGLIQQIGPPDEVYRRPANRFVASFVGSPPMNILDGRIETADGRRRFAGPIPVEIPGLAGATLDDGPAAIGIRSEELVLTGVGTAGSFPAVIELVEPVGADIFLTATVEGGAIITIRVDAETNVAEGENVQVSIAPGAIRVFDGAGDRVRLTSDAA